MLSKRFQLAQLVGFPSYAHLFLKDKLALTPQRVLDSLNELSTRIQPKVSDNYRVLQEAKNRLEGANAGPLEAWDKDFYWQRVKAEKFPLVNSEISSYFSVGNCMEGLGLIVTSLYGVKMLPEEPAPNETWDPSVQKLGVYEESGELIGHIYCDLYARSSKNYAAGHFAIRWSDLLLLFFSSFSSFLK